MRNKNIIRNLRKAKGLSQAELARRSGVSEISIRKYESGERTPKIEALSKIAAVLDLPISELLNDETVIEKHNTCAEIPLITNYKKLNSKGKQKVDEYAEDLVRIDEYTKKED